MLGAVIGCGSDDPETHMHNVDGGVEEAIVGAACSTAPSYVEDLTSCSPRASDYQPRDNASADDTWAECISDDGAYHRIEQSVSTIARVEAYEALAAKLWDTRAPTGTDFLDARVRFEEEQGLGSRVARRYDVHYDPPDDGACDDEGVAAANRDYCVGPGVLQPIVVAAFAEGAEGKNRIVNAAKIEAALQWFLYVSSIKEASTCTDKPRDCDSCWAYYSGGTTRQQPIGLAADIAEWASQTHDRAYDGVLAVRCWRDLDQDIPAGDVALRDRAIGQLDGALVRGMSILVRQRFLELECATGDYQEAALEALRILVPLLDRETRARDAAAADMLMAEVAKAADAVDVNSVVQAIDATYPCP